MSDFHRHPDLQSQIPVIPRPGRPALMSAIPEIASMRGEQHGIHQAYLIIRRKFPEAANYLLSKFKMNRDGSIGELYPKRRGK